MPELIIKYNSPKTLQALTDLAKYFDFEISQLRSENKKDRMINGVTMISGDESIDISPLSEIYSGRDLDPAKLRQSAWQRD